MKVHSIPNAIFETTRSRFIQILDHGSVPWKITPVYFGSSPVGTQYCGDIGFLLDLHRDIDRFSIETEVTS